MVTLKYRDWFNLATVIPVAASLTLCTCMSVTYNGDCNFNFIGAKKQPLPNGDCCMIVELAAYRHRQSYWVLTILTHGCNSTMEWECLYLIHGFCSRSGGLGQW